MKIDSHQHFWDYRAHPDDYVWMSGDLSNLRRNYLPEDLFPLLSETGIDGTISVQAREMTDETDYLLDLAETHSWIHGVVGWLDLCSPNIEQTLERFSNRPKLKGLRMLIHDREDPLFAVSPAHLNGIGCLAANDLTYDLLLKPQHIRPAISLVDLFPNQRFVVDHIAKPSVETGMLSPWREDIIELSQRANVYCKISGLMTLGDGKISDFHQLNPYLDVVLEAFGPARLMMGSDWPVCTCAANYPETLKMLERWISLLSISEQSSIQGNTCAQFYKITLTDE